jgi:hypothetical protein
MSESDFKLQWSEPAFNFKWFIGRAALIAVVALLCWLFGHRFLALLISLMGGGGLCGYITGRAKTLNTERVKQQQRRHLAEEVAEIYRQRNAKRLADLLADHDIEYNIAFDSGDATAVRKRYAELLINALGTIE